MRDFSMAWFSLAGKAAIVSGGNTGLGRAFSLALATAGADVFIPTVVDDAGATVKLVEGVSSRAEVMNVDLTAAEAPKRVVDRCVEVFGKVDILVNSAGALKLAGVEEFSRADWDPMVALNLTAAFELSHEASQVMIPQRSGKIINIASVFAFLGGLSSPAYAATKHGLAGLTKAYADELARYNVQVNAIAPGYFATTLTERTRSDPELSNRITEHIPTGRWGEPVDLMGGVVFLASRASDYVTGHVLVVDGGYLVR